MYISLALIIFIGFAITLNIILKSGTNKSKNTFDKFLKDELAANSVRKKQIDEKEFIKIDSNLISNIKINDIEDNTKLINSREKLLELSRHKMIQFKSPLSNKEIKLKYGVGNFELIVNSEENFNRFIISAIEFAQLLMEKQMYYEAIKILKTIISYNCDISKSFMLLIDCYKITNNLSELRNFKEHILSGQIQCSKLYRDRIVNYSE